MMCGSVPFGDKLQDPYEIYEEIIETRLEFPVFYFDDLGCDLIRKILDQNPECRKFEREKSLREDPYFAGADWEQLQNKILKSPYQPRLKAVRESNEKAVAIGNLFNGEVPAEQRYVRHQLERDGIEFEKSLECKKKTHKNLIVKLANLLK